MLERARIAFGVAAMSVEHVKINEIGKNQSARVVLQSANRLIYRLLIVLGRQVLGHARRIVNRSDLADANDVQSVLAKCRQKIFTRRRHRIVMTILSAIKRAGRSKKR